MRSKLRSESAANRDSYGTTGAPSPSTKAALIAPPVTDLSPRGRSRDIASSPCWLASSRASSQRDGPASG